MSTVMAKVDSKTADARSALLVQTAPLLAEALAVQDDCTSVAAGGDTRHLDVLKNQTKV